MPWAETNVRAKALNHTVKRSIYLEKPSRVTEGVRSAPRCLHPQIDATTIATDLSIIK